MKAVIFKPLFILTLFFSLTSCNEGTDVVESGTYSGTIDEVEPEKSEIYVKTADNKRLELYFTETTTLTKNGETVPFSTLEVGQNVEVDVKKEGKRLDPLAVRIVE